MLFWKNHIRKKSDSIEFDYMMTSTDEPDSYRFFAHISKPSFFRMWNASKTCADISIGISALSNKINQQVKLEEKKTTG